MLSVCFVAEANEPACHQMVHLLRLRKQERLAHVPRQPLAKRAIEAFHVRGLSAPFIDLLVRLRREHAPVCVPGVREASTLAVALRDLLPQPSTRIHVSALLSPMAKATICPVRRQSAAYSHCLFSFLPTKPHASSSSSTSSERADHRSVSARAVSLRSFFLSHRRMVPRLTPKMRSTPRSEPRSL